MLAPGVWPGACRQDDYVLTPTGGFQAGLAISTAVDSTVRETVGTRV